MKLVKCMMGMKLSIIDKTSAWLKEQNPFDDRARFMVQVNSPICTIIAVKRAADSLTAFDQTVKEGLNNSGFTAAQCHKDVLSIVMGNPSLFKVTRLPKVELCSLMKAIKYGHERFRNSFKRIKR
jgi:hypothetical protein